jgi:hypothetical protein
MIAANCSPAVASRRAKDVYDFRVPMLLGAKPKSHIFFSKQPTHIFFPDGYSRFISAVPEGRAARTTRSHKFTFSVLSSRTRTRANTKPNGTEATVTGYSVAAKPAESPEWRHWEINKIQAGMEMAGYGPKINANMRGASHS